ncbi:DUF3891 family protein [Halalkalibacter oceani]|uniref:DUF3891 family protein n=1 Tax=Halalkalibacter oceani TaxID=1653776 RepID=A0A9X2IR98_9BACI|nr:DUF3891 family protein [Halalkalibacter oceani]MCM3715373.1 DUF3891 family protein [Halalkalibacter oceani]
MIISKQNGKLVLVRQDEHMIHAGEITQRWGNDFVAKPDPNDAVVMAIGNHDVGWTEIDDLLPFDHEKSRPVNFLDVDLKQHVDFYGKGYQQIVEQNKYAGLLLGMHWIGLYTSRFGYDPTFTYKAPAELKPFMHQTISEQEKKWVDIKQEIWNFNQSRREFEDNIWLHYELFQIMDRLSLFICLNDLNAKSKVELGPVRFTKDGDYHFLSVESNGNGEISVDPFPFDREFEVSVPLRRIPDVNYSSEKHYRESFISTPIEILKAKLVRKRN